MDKAKGIPQEPGGCAEGCGVPLYQGFGCTHGEYNQYRAHGECCRVCPPTEREMSGSTSQNKREDRANST